MVDGKLLAEELCTYHADGDSGKGEWVTDDVAHPQTLAAIGARMIHFLE